MQIFEIFGSIMLKDNDISGKLKDIEKTAGTTSKNFDKSFEASALSVVNFSKSLSDTSKNIVNAFKNSEGATLKFGKVIGSDMGIKNLINNIAQSDEKFAKMNSALNSTCAVAERVKNGAQALTTVWKNHAVAAVANKVALAAGNTIQFVKNVQDKIETAQIIAKNIALVIQNKAQIVKTIQDKIATAQIVAMYVAEGIHNAAIAAATAAQWLWNAAMSANPIGIMIIAIIALIGVVLLIVTHWKQVSGFLMASFEVIKAYFMGWLNSIMSMFESVWNDITGFFVNTINNLKQIFNGIIEFFTGVFTGNWKKAFEGIKDIIGGIFNQIVNIVKTPINIIIDLINGLIGNMNNIIKTAAKIPGIGGALANVSIPKIPLLAKGTDYFQGGSAIVGEQGPELVQMPRGSKVVPNKDLKREQHFHIDKFIVQSKGDETNTLSQLEFLAAL